jgi:hypothetical protein
MAKQPVAKQFGLILAMARELRDPTVKDVPSLMEYLKKNERSIVLFDATIKKIARSRVVTKQRFDNREIWILEDPTVPETK